MVFSSKAAGDHLKGPAQSRAGAQAMRGARGHKSPHQKTPWSLLPPQAPRLGMVLQRDPQLLLLFTPEKNLLSISSGNMAR